MFHIKYLNFQFDKFCPEFYGCRLVGDGFFLRLAVMEMGYKMTLKDRRYKSGSCVSGQTIKEASAVCQGLDDNQMIIVNIGSTDILNGKELVDILLEMMTLMKICAKKSIIPILTTLAPLGHRNKGNRSEVLQAFNEFLRDNPYNFPVIDINKSFLRTNGTLNHRCLQQRPRNMMGFSKSLVFWSQSGRNKVMDCLRKSMGDAILQILF